MALANTDWIANLYRQHHSAIRAVVWRFGGGSSTEDIVQEVFLRALRFGDRFRHGSSEKTWLIRVAINLTRDYVKRHKLESRYILTSDEDVAAVAAGGQSTADRLEERERLRDALASLPEETVTALILNAVEGYTLAEIAAILQVPEGTIKSRLFYGKDLIRDRLLARGKS